MIEGTQYGFYRCDTIEERDAYEFPVGLDVVVRVDSSPSVTYVGRNGVFKSITTSGSGGYDGDPTTIVQDSTHRFVSDVEKSTWNSKVDDDDSRLTDSRNPTAHVHLISEVTGLQDELDSKAPALGSDDNYVTDAEKAKVSAIDQVYTGTEKTKLSGIATGATSNDTDANLKNTDNHTDGSTNKVYSATDKSKLAGITAGAQVNSAITKAEIEAKLTGAITSHTHDYVSTNVAIVGATKAKITYDTKGLVTAGADLVASDIPTLTASKLSDFNSAALSAAPAETGATIRTALGTTTVGAAINTLVNPSAISFVRVNADNTATARTPAQVYSDLGSVPNANLGNGITNANVAEQSQLVVSATNYYITNSRIALPDPLKTGLVVGSRISWTVYMSKTNAGTGIFQLSIYRGTNGTVADTQDVLQTIGTQTAVVDTMCVDVTLVVTATGATGSYFWSICPTHAASTATGFGLATGTTGLFSGTVSGVNLTTSTLGFGLGFKATTGTPTIRVVQVQAQAINVS